VGETAVLLGAGRRKKGDAVDQAVGISVLVKVGQAVSEGDPLFVLHARKESDIEPAQRRLISAVGITEEEVKPLPLFYGLVT
jgi:thymidine phosphorylase